MSQPAEDAATDKSRHSEFDTDVNGPDPTHTTSGRGMTPTEIRHASPRRGVQHQQQQQQQQQQHHHQQHHYHHHYQQHYQQPLAAPHKNEMPPPEHRDLKHDRSYLSRHHVHLSDGSIVVPDRSSSLSERESAQLTAKLAARARDDALVSDWGDDRPTKEEVEAARRILERFVTVAAPSSAPAPAPAPMPTPSPTLAPDGGNGPGRRSSLKHLPVQPPPGREKGAEPDGELGIVRPLSSAMPPPIVRPRRIIRQDSLETLKNDDGSNGTGSEGLAHDHNKQHGGRPLTALMDPRSQAGPASAFLHPEDNGCSQHPQQQQQQKQQQQDRVRMQHPQRSPILDQLQLYHDTEPPAKPERRILTAATLRQVNERPIAPDTFRGFDGVFDDRNAKQEQVNGSSSALRSLQEATARSTPATTATRELRDDTDPEHQGEARDRLGSYPARQQQQNTPLHFGGISTEDPGRLRKIASIRSGISEDRQVAAFSGSSSRVARIPDFFSPTIFQVVLRNPTTIHQLLKFSESRFCAENIAFLQKVNQYHNHLDNLVHTISDMHRDFVSEASPSQIGLASGTLAHLHAEIRALAATTMPHMESVFDAAQAAVEDLVYMDVYPAFVRHQLTLSASRALASDRGRYQGLGDCFSLTDPRRADNPIVFASDGFVSVTGYSRADVIPRNCRFLQGPQTDKAAVRRVKAAIAEGKEVVELLLNYKKSGEPFWNLLYCTPLFDEHGQIAFFFGGQVNCSTTINSNADVMRVLSMSPNPSDTGADGSSAPIAPASPPIATAPASQPGKRLQPAAAASRKAGTRRTLLKALGMGGSSASRNGGGDGGGMQAAAAAKVLAGMEQSVLDKMEGLDVGAQMREFYTAYSKYLVIDAGFTIRFTSPGIANNLLSPANNAGPVIGSDVFHFLRQNAPLSSSTNPSDYPSSSTKTPEYKNRVRLALTAGSPISIQLRLQTRRSAAFRGDEVFSAHWTPLKDDRGVVCWVVLTLGAMLGG